MDTFTFRVIFNLLIDLSDYAEIEVVNAMKEYAEYIILHEFQEYQRQVREMVEKKRKFTRDIDSIRFNRMVTDILSHPLLNNK